MEVEPQHLEAVADQLAEEHAVTSLYHMTGPSKLHMHGIFFTDNQEMETFFNNKAVPSSRGGKRRLSDFN
ncbi:hypothetical protein GCM10020331_022240 [Ectobacillus funiculus]